LTELKTKKDNLDERFGFGQIPQELYLKLSTKIDGEFRALTEKNEVQEIDISNLKNKLKLAINFSQNVSKRWLSGSLNTKCSIQKFVFPEGLVLDTKERQNLTSNVKLLFPVKADYMRSSEDAKKNFPSFLMGSPW
jgi:hypothetical protein